MLVNTPGGRERSESDGEILKAAGFRPPQLVPTTTATDEPLTNQHRRALHADAAQASELSDHGTGFVRHSIFQHGITLLVEFGELRQDKLQTQKHPADLGPGMARKRHAICRAQLIKAP